ncbi:Ldl recept a and EGF CA domain containing protein [Trichuris trichiura]|uniref:Ldl recept a and EGF CA domain containing protein n=1 Tax=Trichuris trichiura TaxID=36087 RepID=A0A077ZC72_TRITR|nr:Ldl recept a and EGF CA domain containing protein [Trichuris trichiura]
MKEDAKCHTTEFDCQSAFTQCINASKVGDGKIDCSNGFDEGIGCPNGYFLCHDRSGCLEPRKFMDGVQDCFDNSDEPCLPSEYFCEGSKTCIDRCKVQDGVPDCPDGKDEECSPFQFHCRCGQPRCINLDKFNNSRLDCLDGSDEPSSPEYLSDRHCLVEQARNALPSELITSSHLVFCDDSPDVKCNTDANEVCLVVLGKPHCACRPGFIKLKHDHACFPTSATLWKAVAMTDGWLNRPLQPPVFRNDHCSPYSNSSCLGRNEQCSKTGEVFSCNCKEGHIRHPKTHKCAGYLAELVDECSDRTLNDCDPGATCIDNPISYECLCKEGYLDVSPSPRKYPGRKCIPRVKSFKVFLAVVDECKDTRTNDCDPNSTCLDLPSGYTCRCKAGFRDASPEPKHYPGRRCSACTPSFAFAIIELVNECKNDSLNDCDKVNAHCIDTVDSFVCQCKTGFIDQDPQRAGRICTTDSEEENASPIE